MELKRTYPVFYPLMAMLLMNGLVVPGKAQELSAEVFGGTSWSLPTNLRIEQPNEASIFFKARYRTRPWHGSPYYAYRLGYHHWNVELVHHKLYLQNPPPDVQHFEVSHGYNLALVSRNFATATRQPWFRVGLGLVIGHPEGQIRNRAINPVRSLLGGGYHISGLALQAAVGPQLSFAQHWFIRPEFKVTGAWARMPLAGGGKAYVPNIAMHSLIGVGYQCFR